MRLRFRLALLIALSAVILLCFACSATKPAGPRAPLDTTGGAGSITSPESNNATALVVASGAAAARPEQALAAVPVSAADPQWGSVDAPVTIVEFSDFQCPFCGRVTPTLAQLKRKYGPARLRLVFKHNPLPFHVLARPAAEAAAAVFMLAGSDAFFTFHDLAFANQQSLAAGSFERWAATAGVQAPALHALLASGGAARKVDEDMRLASKLGASGTPAFRINGVTLSGAQPLEKFVETVDEQLAAAARLAQSGTPPRSVYVALTDKNTVAPPAAALIDPDADDEPVWKMPIATDDPQRGDRDALVTIVIFSDFQCPFCQRVESTLAELRRLYGKELRFVWKDDPLPFHPRAMPTAQLARFVYQTRGNDAFWSMHDALFATQPKLDDDDLRALAKTQGLPSNAVKTATESEKLRKRIEESQAQAEDFQARGTPHFFINGRRLVGAQPLEAFEKRIDAELERAKALVAHGIQRANVYAELTKDGQEPPPPETKHVGLPADAASRGPAKAPVVIQEFSDFQCPFCQRVEPTLSALEQEFKGSVRIVWRHLPLPFHDNAQAAAEASEEVLKQKGPTAFWKYHDLLFAAQSDPGLDRQTLDSLAFSLGVDMGRFAAALDNRTHRAKVDADAAAASQAGINGTPGFLINDYYLSGAQPAEAFRELIKLALKAPPRAP